MALYKVFLLLSFILPLTLSCLQCDTDLRIMLWQIEGSFIPALIKEPCLRSRARILVNGMSNSFFADYADREYLGCIGKAFLDTIVKYRATFLRQLKKGLKKYKSKACSSTKCGAFKQKVLDCARCTKVMPSCFNQHRCSGERITRVAIKDSRRKGKNGTRRPLAPDVVTVNIAGLMLLTGMVARAVKSRLFTKRLIR